MLFPELYLLQIVLLKNQEKVFSLIFYVEKKNEKFPFYISVCQCI